MNMNLFKKLGEDKYPVAIIDDSYVYPTEANILNLSLPVSHEPNWELLQTRLEMKYKNGKLITIHCSSGTFTPEQQIQEIKNKTQIGYTFMMVENGLLEYLLKGGNYA